ncbi:hypothetical protein C8R47DRAFT_1086007, partial [Mycena vitilis]
MPAQKRRVLVAFETSASGSDQKRQRKLAVSIDSNATNAQLAHEIAATVHEGAVTLEISGGFELRDQDGIDMIGEEELVTARVAHTEPAPSLSVVKAEPSFDASADGFEVEAVADVDPPPGMQIRLVTAELARLHAKATPREKSEATNGVFAFGGEFVDGNTTLKSLQREAARVLQWDSAELMEIDDPECDHGHRGEAACSCSVAQEIFQSGLATTLHCRLTHNGANCGNSQCPYSHVELKGPVVDGPCSLCGDALAFPCPRCPADLSAPCPLVQNAGCGHLHHGHCIGARVTGFSAGCPSGCPSVRFPQEATIFDDGDARIVIAWNGDRIDSIPLLPSIEGSSQDPVITMSTDSVILAVERFLEDHDFVRCGLALRLHARNASTETLRFARSTLVSVCPALNHPHRGCHRFPLFKDKVFAEKRVPVPGPFAIDLHTSDSPIIACGCTPIKDLFPAPAAVENAVLLYAVKRHTEIPDPPEKRDIVSKQSMYLADAAWHPAVPQTPRGMSALLSSLYLLAHSVAQKGVAGEQKVLALVYAQLRFPPAVRTLAALLLNKVPRAEEKAALAEALYHALGEFSSRGPSTIISRETRRFETTRIFLAYIASAAGGASTAPLPLERAVEDVSLVCQLSQKRLADPVVFNGVVVERRVAHLHEPGAPLFHTITSSEKSARLVELPPKEIQVLRALLACSRGLHAATTLVLRVGDIGSAPPSFMATLDSAARDYIQAIRRANQTDLVTRGPLELKSADVVPPQIVLDQEGFLAVFTGRGCGTARDVNFFRPTNGGDTEVDVNDISLALEKVILARKLEDTWQVDSFGEVSAISRPPEEAIVLCLDLSRSMAERSGVTGQSGRHRQDSEDRFDVEIEARKLADTHTSHLTRSQIMNHAGAYIRAQHASCHRPWWAMLHPDSDDSKDEEEEEERAKDLLQHLAKLASRDALKLSLKEGQYDEDSDSSDDELEEDMYGDLRHHVPSDRMLQMTSFVAAVEDRNMNDELSESLRSMLRDGDFSVVGIHPFSVPRSLLDFKTGDLLVDPVHPKNSPRQMYVNSGSKAWFESQRRWPGGPSDAKHDSVAKLRKAVKDWIAGTDITPKVPPGSKRDLVIVTFRQRFDQPTTWNLLPDTPTETLYALANRASKGLYASFTLRVCSSNTIVRPTGGLRIADTELASGGAVEVTHEVYHTRKPYVVDITGEGLTTKVLIPKDSTVLALLSYIDLLGLGISDLTLWHGLTESGDGMRSGQIAKVDHPISHYASSDTVCFEYERWRWISSGAQQSREESKNLSRLDLLKELFNVFLNRAGSFDTAVSLVLGLVTFSDTASVEQELTPIFEKFRERLETLSAEGDTAVYDALDSARQVLINYRPDLHSLRRRIVIVSDGEDTSSDLAAWQTCGALQRARIIVDSVQVGAESDGVLHAISVATGGYRFCPRTSLADALSIFDLETVLFSGDRPFRAPKPLVQTDFQFRTYQSFGTYPIDFVSVDQFPPRADHRKLNQPVKAAATSVNNRNPGSDERIKRIMREIKSAVTDPHPNIDLYVNHRDMSFLKIILEAPKDVDNCPYRGGTFLLSCDLPAGYPRDPPEIRFVTFILHPNVSKQGKVCIAELGRLWSSDITLKEIFSLVYGTLLTPDLENPLEIQASLKYYDDDGTYALAVALAVTKHASKTRAQWREELEVD